MERLSRNKELFIGLSCLSIGSLIGSFGYPLQKLEIYRQTEVGQFNVPVVRTYLITENDQNYPYGFSKIKAKLFAAIHVDYKLQKILLLSLAAGSALAALSVGYETVPLSELDEEISSIRAKGKKELLLASIKHQLAMNAKAQHILFREELKALLDEYSTPEQEALEADEINALYDYQVEQPGQPEEKEESFRKQFPESMDVTSWKAIQKARQSGVPDEEIVKDVLNCSKEIGLPYIIYLEQKSQDF